MFAVVAITLAVLSVYFWRQEAELYLSHMRKHHAKRGDLGFLTGGVTGIPKLAPLAADIGITVSIVTIFGLGGGILGAVVGLAMSNAVSFFINREVSKYGKPAAQPTQMSQPAEGETTPPSSSKKRATKPADPVTGAWKAYSDWYWNQVAKAIKRVEAEEGA